MRVQNVNHDALPKEAGRDVVWLTKKELAYRWKLSTRKIERMVSKGELAAKHFGKSVRFALKVILDYENPTGGHHV
jgi:excisionase family DNA binding protein